MLKIEKTYSNTLFLLLTFTLLVTLSGCGFIKRYAMNQVAGVLSSGTDTFYSDDDPELIRESLPFALKLMESILAETPRHRGLLLQCCSGFTQYAYGFINEDADVIEDDDYKKAEVLRKRTKKLLIRARNYGIRGLELRYRNFGENIRKDTAAAVAKLDKKDVDLAYWLAASWGAAISVSKDDPELIADQVIVEALFDRCLVIDEAFDKGAIHEAMISYEMARQGGKGKPEDRARKHFERALKLSKGLRAAPYVNYAESVSVQMQNSKEFTALLNKALAIDTEKIAEARTINLVMQKRAKWLLSLKEDLFVD
ncbi:MAG: TRAP transporter TatT component family protein [Planctomycetota bacterium]